MFEAADVKYATSMKRLGWIIIVLSIVVFGLATAVYEFLQGLHGGGYWGAILPFICGVLGVSSRNKACVITGIVLSVFGIIIAAIAVYFNLFVSVTFLFETGCYNTHTDQAWGTPQGQQDAYDCAQNGTSYQYYFAPPFAKTHEVELQHYNYNYNNPNSTNDNFFYNHPDWIYYYNQNHVQNWYQNHRVYYWDYSVHERQRYIYQCMCTDGFMCYGYTLGSGNDCGSILTTYAQMYMSCVVLLLILGFCTCLYSIFACCSACSNSVQTLPVTTVEPVSVEMAGAAVYVQPGMLGQQPVVYGSAATVVSPQHMAQYAPLVSAEGDAVAFGDDKFI